MSELGEQVERALTPEWRTTAEIADAIPTKVKDVRTHREMVRKHLLSLERYGVAEKDGPPARWRRRDGRRSVLKDLYDARIRVVYELDGDASPSNLKEALGSIDRAIRTIEKEAQE